VTDFSPLVNDTTKAQSESVETVLSRLKSGRVYSVSQIGEIQ
jgi:hypothetical protein